MILRAAHAAPFFVCPPCLHSLRQPALLPLAPLLARLPPAPDALALAELATSLPVHTASGQVLRFVPPQDDGLGYEARIAVRGEVETRPDNWHDWFNGLVWLTFPGPRQRSPRAMRRNWRAIRKHVVLSVMR